MVTWHGFARERLRANGDTISRYKISLFYSLTCTLYSLNMVVLGKGSQKIVAPIQKGPRLECAKRV